MDLLIQGRNLVFQTSIPPFLILILLISPIPPHDSNESLDIHNIPIILTLMTTPHQPKQIKSHWYYTFWSIATLAVVLGQIYVATGYRALADALKLSIL